MLADTAAQLGWLGQSEPTRLEKDESAGDFDDQRRLTPPTSREEGRP
jgi:hypothetical protein